MPPVLPPSTPPLPLRGARATADAGNAAPQQARAAAVQAQMQQRWIQRHRTRLARDVEASAPTPPADPRAAAVLMCTGPTFRTRFRQLRVADDAAAVWVLEQLRGDTRVTALGPRDLMPLLHHPQPGICLRAIAALRGHPAAIGGEPIGSFVERYAQTRFAETFWLALEAAPRETARFIQRVSAVVGDLFTLDDVERLLTAGDPIRWDAGFALYGTARDGDAAPAAPADAIPGPDAVAC